MERARGTKVKDGMRVQDRRQKRHLVRLVNEMMK